jgi:hypothetical protein
MRTLLLLLAMMLSMTTVAQQVPFEDTPTSLTPTFGGSLDTGDVNEDGNMDYLQTGSLAHPVGDNPIPRTILSVGDGNGNVTENSTHNFPDVMSGGGLFADVNNDGHLDAYIFGEKSNGELVSEIHLGDGNGNFTFHQSFTGYGVSRAAFGDLDGDGDLDLINNTVTPPIDFHTRIYRNDNGTFTELTNNTLEGVLAGDVVIFDYDNDGNNDVLNGGDKPSENITNLYKNLGNFNFSLVSSPFPAASGSSFDVADLDDDGDPDVGMNGFGDIGMFTHVYLNNGDGTFAPPQELTGTSAGDIVFKDIDNDGDEDTLIIGATNQSGGKAAKLYLNDGTGNMIFNRSFNPGLTNSSAIICDMDNDGKMDIVYTGNEADFPFAEPDIKVFRNTTLGVEEFTQDKVAVYPNPTHGIVNIELSSNIFATNYMVTDMSGKQFKVSNNGTEIDLSSLADGMYLLTISSESGQSITKRVIKN